MGCSGGKPAVDGAEAEYEASVVEVRRKARKMSTLGSNERPDLLLSLKLGLDPNAPIVTEQYSLDEVLGKGHFGVVQAVTHRETGRRYACKLVKTQHLNINLLKSEVKILQACRHPNIISVKEVFATEDLVYFVMELARGGDMFEYMLSRKNELTERFAVGVTAQLADALEYMHAKGVVHRDMKPENLLLETKSNSLPLVKICDFGLSKMFSSRQQHNFRDHAMVMKSRVGSQFYASPELLQNADTYDESIDIWGLGLIIYIMLSGKHPFEGSMDVYSDTVNAKLHWSEPVWASGKLSSSAKELIQGLLRADPSTRTKAKDVLAHDWLKEGVAKDTSLASSLAYLRRFQVKHVREAALKVVTQKLSDEEIAEIREVFLELDVDGKGFLSMLDLREGLANKMRDLGASEKYNVTAILRRIVMQANLDQEGKGPPATIIVTFEQFLTQVLEEDDALLQRYLTQLFETMDVDGCGNVTSNDLRTLLLDFDMQLDDEELETMIEKHALPVPPPCARRRPARVTALQRWDRGCVAGQVRLGQLGKTEL